MLIYYLADVGQFILISFNMVQSSNELCENSSFIIVHPIF